MNAAILIGTNASYLALTFLPAIVWLLFYLREDRHPEPKLLLLLTFLGGMASVVLAIVGECVFVQILNNGSCREGFASGNRNMFTLFLAIAFIEEYCKYLAVKFLVLRRKDFDEPVDAMIYMITAALGFAAVENALFIFPLFDKSLIFGLEVTTNRFLGANLLHALSSAIVGFFLARAWFSPRRHHFIAIGVVVASLLHALFNYLILVREGVPEGTIYLFLLLSLMALVVFIDFEHLRVQEKNELPPEAGGST
ncbi:MAG: PrsW family glutamic-type intramembrane protease [Candidatus Sungbacteria bacterium]|nr:PrsW family glutamic-type intramembrane protease [bacterium]MDZ4260070.1 PrsW family glutamic-type intramembrane protease [Candidatus Sungbacteria bacterium]